MGKNAIGMEKVFWEVTAESGFLDSARSSAVADDRYARNDDGKLNAVIGKQHVPRLRSVLR